MALSHRFRIERIGYNFPSPLTFVLLLRGTKGGEDVLAMMEGKRYGSVVSTRACVSGCELNPEAVFDNATSRLRVLFSEGHNVTDHAVAASDPPLQNYDLATRRASDCYAS